MMAGIAFKLLKVVVDKKAGSLKTVPRDKHAF